MVYIFAFTINVTENRRGSKLWTIQITKQHCRTLDTEQTVKQNKKHNTDS